MRPGILIRAFAPADQPAASRLILAGLGEHFGAIDETRNPDLDDIQRHYVDRGSIFLVAELAGALVGTAALVRENDAESRLVRVSVISALRRQGIARTLVSQLVAEARARGYVRVLVETNLDWNDALGLYRAMGFEEYARDEESRHLSLAL